MSEPDAVPPAPATGLRLAGWAAAGALAALEAFALLYVSGFVAWMAASGCNEDPTPGNRTNGLLGLLALLAVAAGPWLGVAVLRRKWLVAVLGVLAASPVLYRLVRGLSLEYWRGDFCF